ARVNKFARDNVTFNAGYTTLTVPVTGSLAAGCTYWVNFRGVTDASGNPIDPNPTSYEFTTTGTATSFPVANNNTWYYESGDGEATMSFRNYSQSTGAFNEVFQDSKGDTQEVVHLKKTSTQIQHLGRDEYHDGEYDFSMIWDTAIPYVKLPVENYLGQSWTFSTTASISDSMTMDLSGHMEVEASQVDLVCDALYGTFKNCTIHHLIGSYTMYLHGNPVDEGEVHQIMWLAPGVGPVQIVNIDGGGSDTLRVVDWSF
ncbi:MAG: Ig-like domain-containing protein, partial [Candidatus Krumholzibacteria bacterium]|nr:Ig-like domain-containing protein [Candidatus Krumholzibacteria bacterium]